MKLGINFHVKGKLEEKKRKDEVLLSYENVWEKVRSNDLAITWEDTFKCELEKFGAKRVSDRTRDIILRDQYRKAKKIRSDRNNVIRKSDESNKLVILNKKNYEKQRMKWFRMKTNSRKYKTILLMNWNETLLSWWAKLTGREIL